MSCTSGSGDPLPRHPRRRRDLVVTRSTPDLLDGGSWPPRAARRGSSGIDAMCSAARGRLSITDRREPTPNARNGGTMHNAAVAGLLRIRPGPRQATASHTARHRSAPVRVRWTSSSGPATPSRGDNDPNLPLGETAVSQSEDRLARSRPRTGTDSANTAQLMQSGGVSASGGTKRLIAAGLVLPITPGMGLNIFDSLKRKDYAQWCSLLACLTAAARTSFSTTPISFCSPPLPLHVVSRLYLPGGGQDQHLANSAIYIVDAAMYLKAHNADLKITNPYELDLSVPCAVKLLKYQKKIVGQYWSTAEEQMQKTSPRRTRSPYEPGGTRWKLAEPCLAASARQADPIRRAATGCLGQLDDQSTAKTPQLHVHRPTMASRDATPQATVWFGEAPTSAAACAKAETLRSGALRQGPCHG